MMSDLFSSLDGCYSAWSWAIPMMVTASFFSTKIWTANHTNSGMQAVSTFVGESQSLLPLKLFLTSLMFFLITNNLLGLTPFVYGVTSSLWFASSLALVLWGLLLASGWIYSFKKSAAHLAPSGAPSGLIPLLVLIETVSILIRPLTLTVRLIANISAGHIVLSLIANCLTSMTGLSALMVFFVSVGYNMFEVFVCCIQAYIFSLLVGLYAQEHP